MTTLIPTFRTRRLALRAMFSRALALFVCASLATAAPLHAQSTPPTPSLPGSSLKLLAGTSGLPSFEEMQASLQRYQGATAAFSQTYATLSAQPLDAWLQSNGSLLTASLGVPALPGTLQNSVDLQAFLANSGFAAQLKSWGTSSQDVLRDPLSASIVKGSMDFASSFASMRMPDTAPLTSSLSTAGLFTERAVTALATDFPDLIGQVRSSGALSPSAMAAWRKSMKNAATASLPNAADGLIDKCQAGLLWAMGSGSATGARALTGNSCGACIAQGLYMHAGFSNMLNTEVKSSVIPPADFNQLPAWRRAAITTSNPAVTATPNFTAQGSGCTSSSAAANTVLSGTLAGLEK